MVIWIGLALLAAAGVVVVIWKVLGTRTDAEGTSVADVDPLFTSGIAIAGAGAALISTLGPIMYLVLLAGLVMLAVGAYRMRSRGHPNDEV